VLDRFDLCTDLGHDRPFEPWLGHPSGTPPDKGATERRREREPPERPARSARDQDEPAERAARGKAQERLPFHGRAEREPGGDSAAEAND